MVLIYLVATTSPKKDKEINPALSGFFSGTAYRATTAAQEADGSVIKIVKIIVDLF